MNNLTRQEVDAKLDSSESKVDTRLANFDTSIKTGFAELRAEMAKQNGDLRAEMAKQNGDLRADMANLQFEMHKNTADLIKWAIGLAVAVVGITVGLITYINKSAEKPAPQIANQTPAPFILTVPAGSALLNPAPQAPAATTLPRAK